VHIPDGFIDAPVSISAAVLATGAVAWSLRGARKELLETSAPIAGMTAVFIFAAQMINFPVGAGTSGHLAGAALAAILIGPHAAVIAMTMVLVVQALAFADGGLSALGLNVLNLGVVAVIVAWIVFRALIGSSKRLPSTSRLWWAAGIAGTLSIVAAAGAFSLEFALGGTAPLSAQTVAVAMLGVHTLIGVMEGVITALVVGAVAAVRPDLVYGLRRQRASASAVTEVSPEEVRP